MFIAIKQYYYRYLIRRSARALDHLDDIMTLAGYNRTQRRQFWRALTNKVVMRSNVFNELK